MLVTFNSANVTPQPSTSGQVNPRSRQDTSRAQPTPIPAFVPPTAQLVKPKPKKREYAFTGVGMLVQPYTDFETPLQYFLYFFDDDLLDHIAEESTKYSIQKNPSKPDTVTKMELNKY